MKMSIMVIIFGQIKKDNKHNMKHLREYNNWVTDTTDKNVVINYGDEKPKLSDVVIEAIKFIEDNYDEINPEINSTNESRVGFYKGMKFTGIGIYKDKRKNFEIPIIRFDYRDSTDSTSSYSNDITEYDYDYLEKYFYKIYKDFRKKTQERHKEEYKSELQKIEDKKVKKNAEKYNI